MTKEMFLKWLLSEPKFIVWLSTLHRIHAAVSGTCKLPDSNIAIQLPLDLQLFIIIIT